MNSAAPTAATRPTNSTGLALLAPLVGAAGAAVVVGGDPPPPVEPAPAVAPDLVCAFVSVLLPPVTGPAVALETALPREDLTELS